MDGKIKCQVRVPITMTMRCHRPLPTFGARPRRNSSSFKALTVGDDNRQDLGVSVIFRAAHILLLVTLSISSQLEAYLPIGTLQRPLSMARMRQLAGWG